MTKKISPKNNKGDFVMALQALLNKNKVSTQEEIREALTKKGFLVNQAKISRALHKLGVVKMLEDNKSIYCIPHERAAITSKDSLKFVILNIQCNESMIVIRTTPGSAQLVAHLLDNKSDLEILGTVAGDDTIFIAPESTKNIKSISHKIYKLLLE